MRGRAVGKRGELVTYFAFDLLFLNGRDLRALPLLERKTRLRKLIGKDTPRLRYVDHIETEGELMFKHAVQIGIEGVVGKRADSPYIGGRSKHWLKTKPAGVSRWVGAAAAQANVVCSTSDAMTAYGQERACKIDFREADIAKQTRSRSGLGEAC